MARKVLNRKELRAESEAAEASAKKDKAKEPKPAKKAAKSRSRKKEEAVVRLKAFWGVFNQSLKRVALFEYSQRKQADKKATELTASQKTPHFVQLVKEVLQD